MMYIVAVGFGATVMLVGAIFGSIITDMSKTRLTRREDGE